MDFLLFPGGIIGIVVALFLYLRKQERGHRRSISGRTVRIIESNLPPAEDISRGFAAVATSMRALRKAKQEEHAILLKNWQNSYLELLPDTDPEKTTHQATLQGVKIETASFVLDASGISAKSISAKSIATASLSIDNELPVVDDGPEWRPLPYSKKDPDEEMTYSDRRIQRAGAFVRSEPFTKAAVYGVADGNSIMHFDGYVYGEAVAGNDIWFVYIGRKSGLPKFVHSIATTNRQTSGLPYMASLGSTFQAAKGSKAIQMPVAEVKRRREADALTRNLELRRSKKPISRRSSF